MKFLAGLVVLVAILGAILVPQTLYTVDETELAIVTRFGEPRNSITSPGLYVKTPFIETVRYFEKRILIFDAPPDSLLTEDKRRLVIDVYARARIVDPLLFFRTVQTESQATSRAVDIITSELRREIALDTQIEVIQETREEIMNRVRDSVTPKLAEFGIETIDVRIKRADFPDTVAESVYARMQAERKRIADRERAEGAERDAEVRANVDRQAAIIRAEAERDAQIIRGEGEAEAVRIFAESLGQDPEFYAFQRSLQAYKNFLPESGTTVVLPADSSLFQFLQTPSGNGGSNDARASARPSDSGGSGFDVALELLAANYLAGKLGVGANELTLVRSSATEWSDGSLGCPRPGMAYTQAIVPGYEITFEHQGNRYAVHTNSDASFMTSCE